MFLNTTALCLGEVANTWVLGMGKVESTCIVDSFCAYVGVSIAVDRANGQD